MKKMGGEKSGGCIVFVASLVGVSDGRGEKTRPKTRVKISGSKTGALAGVGGNYKFPPARQRKEWGLTRSQGGEKGRVPTHTEGNAIQTPLNLLKGKEKKEKNMPFHFVVPRTGETKKMVLQRWFQ